jgi:long-chain acyl-CoA synthetase
MKEFTEASVVDPPKEGSLVDHLTDNAEAYPQSIAIQRKTPSGWSAVTFAQFHEDVRAVAKGIAAAGVQPGDRIGVMSSTRYEWTLVDYAIWYAGAISVPIYETSSTEQVEWCLSDSGAVGVFLEGPRHLAVFEEAKDALPNVAHAWVFDSGAISELKAAGEVVGDDDLDGRRATLSPDSVATIIYTSGTTGRPKGCVLSHGNLMFQVDAVVKGMPQVFTASSSTLLFLPIAHVFGRVIELGCIRSRVVLGHTDITNAVSDMGEFHPTFLLAVPRVFEKIYNGARQTARDGGKGAIFERGASVAIQYSEAMDKGSPGLPLQVQHFVFDKLLYGKLRDKMGGEVKYAVSGGAALGSRLGHFFRGIGITVLEGYGLTETSAAHTVNRPEKVKIGSVGRPVPGSSVRIADDGEILLKGPQVFQGYWNNDQATAEVMEADGWFHSGDIGELDDAGFLRITGRKKELIVTAGGKNVAPAVLEDRIRSNHLVSQCMVVGDAKPFIAALVTIDVDAFPAWKAEKGKPESATVADLVHDADLRTEVQSAVDQANKAVSSAEAIKKFEILPFDWTEEGGQLTPSMKLKRNVVMAECGPQVEALYA